VSIASQYIRGRVPFVVLLPTRCGFAKLFLSGPVDAPVITTSHKEFVSPVKKACTTVTVYSVTVS